MSVSKEEITKALGVLGIPVDSIIEKSEKDELEKTEQVELEKAEQAKLEKAKKEKAEEENDGKSKEEIEAEKEALEKAEKTKETEAEKVVEKEEMEKAEKAKKEKEEPIQKAEISEILKSETSSLHADIESLITLQKANMETISELTSKVQALDNRGVAPKSFTTQEFVQKEFEKATSEGKKVYVLGQHNSEINEILKAKSGVNTGNIDENWAKALMTFEATGQLGVDARKEILKSEDITIL